jgi:hypothetical protein
MKEETNQENKTPEVAASTSKKDMIKQRLMEMKNTYDQMIKLRKENLDTFKKKEMSKYQINNNIT